MEYGLIVAQGLKYISSLKELIETHPDLPDVARNLCDGLLQHIESLSEKITVLEKGLRPRPTGRCCITLDDYSWGRCDMRHSD
ncbi:hypothetical protein AJ87_48960 [Rhizobium yanglingense]|nr:hypothetical protein AJ87_48960 [Rhizobium yanglingense]